MPGWVVVDHVQRHVGVDQYHRESFSSRQREYLVGGHLHRRATPEPFKSASQRAPAGCRRPHHDFTVGPQLEFDAGAGLDTKELADVLGHRYLAFRSHRRCHLGTAIAHGGEIHRTTFSTSCETRPSDHVGVESLQSHGRDDACQNPLAVALRQCIGLVRRIPS